MLNLMALVSSSSPRIFNSLLMSKNAKSTHFFGLFSWDDIELLKKLGKGKIDMTIGSALDLFGGTLSYERLAAMHF